MKIEKGALVKVQYTLRDAEEKDIIEQTSPENPLTFLYGMGFMLPKFEEHLKGLSKGEKFDFVLKPEDAYGVAREDLQIPLERAMFERDGKFDDELVKEGASLAMMTSTGQPLQGIVQEINDTHVVMDFNHPLADCPLHFVGEVEEVREPTEQEYNAFMNPSKCGSCSSSDCSDGCN